MTATGYRWGAAHAVRAMGRFLAHAGYRVGAYDGALLATKQGYGLGPFLPWSDFLFVHDFDAAPPDDGDALERLHQRSRDFGESRMRVPRLLRYRVPNSVTIGVSSTGFEPGLIAVARMSRHGVNTGEKNAVYLFDLAEGTLYSQGVERDPLKYLGTWETTINPSNRVHEMLTATAAAVLFDKEPEIFGGGVVDTNTDSRS